MATRREVLQGLIVSIGGASVLNACGGAATIIPSQARNLRYYSADEYAFVSRVSDLIIPRTDTPGALDVRVPGFLDGLMAEWANDVTRRRYRQELSELRRMLGEDFTELGSGDAEQRLAGFDAAAFNNRPPRYGGYRTLKQLITQAYFASEDGALREQGWVAVPGRWDPCADIQ